MFNAKVLPGILFATALAVVAFLAQNYLGLLGTEVYAITFGLAIGNLFTLPQKFTPGIQFSEKKILGWAIALLGLQLSFRNLSLSIWLIPVLLIVIAISILLGKILAKKLSVNPGCGYMIGVGNAICGASAIAAVSPFLAKKSHETGVAIGVVNVLGTIGMLLLPLLALGLGLSQQESGVLVGGTLQAVGQVVGGGYAIGEEAGQIATLVKLGRVLMLGPIVIITAFMMHTNSSTKIDRKRILPGFIIVFVLLLILVNVLQIPAEILEAVKTLDKWLITIAMAAIGLQIKFKDLITQGPRALLLGSIIFVVQIALVLGFIYGQEYFN